MAGRTPSGGRLLVEIIGDVDRVKFVNKINAAIKGVTANVPVDLKVKKGAAGALIKEQQADFNRRKVVPVLPVKLKVAKGEPARIVREANAHIKTLKRKPSLNVGVKLSTRDIRTAVAAANATMLAASKAAPKIKVALDLDVDEMKAIKEARVKVQGMRADMQATPLQIPVDLDDKSLALVSRKAQEAFRTMQAKIDAQYAEHLKVREMMEEEAYAKQLGRQRAQYAMSGALAEAHGKKRDADLQARARNIDGIVLEHERKHQSTLNQLLRNGLDKRSLEELKHVNKMALLHERAELSKRRVSRTTLRVLRNDLSQFDVSTTRTLRRLGFLWAGFTAATAAGFGIITGAAITSYARAEQAVARTVGVLAADEFVKAMERGEDGAKAFEKAVGSLGNTIMRESERVAIETIFNTTEVAEGAKALAQAGLNAAQITDNLNGKISTLGVVARFAQNEQIDLAEATEQLTGGIYAAGLEISQLAELTDKFTYVSNATNASAVQVAQSFSNRAAPAMRAYGQSIDQTLTVLSLLSKANIRGLTGGEQAGIMARFITQAYGKATDTWKKYGIAMEGADGKQQKFTHTLAQLTELWNELARTRGIAAAQNFFRDELKLTERSSAALRQIMPQINQMGATAEEMVKGLDKMEGQIVNSSGAMERQASVFTNTLSFQFEQFWNEVSALARKYAEPMGSALREIFKQLNGETEGSISLFTRLESKFASIGRSVSRFLIPAIEKFAFGGEGADFFTGIMEGMRATLSGIRNFFGAFRDEVYGGGSGKGFFSILGDIFASVGRFTERTLPRIGRGLGVVVSFVRENTRTVKALAAAWLTLFTLSKSLRLFILPIVGAVGVVKSLRDGLTAITTMRFAGVIGGWISSLTGYSAATSAAAASTNALATAQARAAAAGAAAAATGGGGGFKGFSQRATAVSASAEAARLAAAASSASVLSRSLSVLRGNLKGLGRAFLPVVLGAGLLKGALDQVNLMMGGDGNVTARDFTRSMIGVARAVGSVVKVISSFIKGITNALFWLGRLTGQILTWSIAGLIRKIGDAAGWAWEKIGGLTTVVGGLSSALPALGGSLMGVIPGLRQVSSAIDDIKNSHGDKEFSRLSDGAQSLGRQLTWLGEGWEKAGATGIANTFYDLSESVTHNNKRIDENIAAMSKLNAARREAHQKELRRKADEAMAEWKKTNILGVANSGVLDKYIKLTAAQKAMGWTQDQAAKSATDYQKRQANLAYVTDVLTGKVKDARASMKLMSNSSHQAGKNLEALAGGEDKLQAMLKAIAAGNKRAANSFIAMSTVAQRAAIDKARTIIVSAQSEMKAIGASAQLNMRASILYAQQSGKMKRAQRAMRENLKFIDEQKDLVDRLLLTGVPNDLDLPDATAAADEAAEAAERTARANNRVATAAEKAEEAVNKLTVAKFKFAAQRLIDRIAKMPGAYKATAYQAAMLAKAMPSVDRAIERQTAMVTKLDEALQALQGTQLLGTKAASDEAFAFDQQVKALQLQKVDLQIAGAGADDPAIEAIDEQIAAIQLQAERAALAASIGLDPLKKQLEDTFTPVKELSFDAIIAEFTKLTTAREKAQGDLSKTEALKKKLDAIVEAQANKFTNVGLNVTKGIVAGTKSGQAGVTKAAKDTAQNLWSTAKKELGIQSPSTVMAKIGLQSSQGFEQGIRSGRPGVVDSAADIRRGAVTALVAGVPHFNAAGVQVLTGFKDGMRSVWNDSGPWGNSIKEFVTNIAEWIKENKGPLAYDATLLRPAGQVMMEGFKGGLEDGFSEVKGWVKGVAGQIGDSFPKELMFERSARFLLNNAKADATFTPEDAFNDLLPEMLTGIAGMDSSLSFLHKTLSLADTTDMARKLIALYPSMNLSGVDRAAGTRTAAGFISDHTYGTAADLGTGRSTPTAESRELFSKLKPLLGIVFKQLIHAGVGLSANGGSFPDSAHGDHIHAAWLKGVGFDKHSGKKGSSLNIPGLPPMIAQALLAASQKTGINATLLAAISKQESGWRAQIGSPAGAQGLMQLMPATARGLGVTNINDPFQNALGGAKYIKAQLARFGSLKLALAAYNAGPNAPGLAQGQIPPYRETQHYVEAVMEYLRKFSGVGNFRAMGGNVNANTPTWVGERGRELWVPDRSGTVISNKNIEDLIRLAKSGQVGKQGGGDYIDNRTQHFHSNASDTRAVADIMDAKMRQQVRGVRR